MPSSAWSQFSHSQSTIRRTFSHVSKWIGPPVLVEEVDRVDHLAVDVELALPGRAVPDVHRRRVAVARPRRMLDLRKVGAAVDAVHDLERARRADLPLARAVGQPAHERGRLLGEAEPQQAVERERRVADPRVAVVPVALAPDLLGQRRRGRRHQRPGRRVGQQLQRQRRALHGLAPAAAVARPGEPPAPVEHGGVERLGGLLLRVRPCDVVVGDALEHERLRLAGAEVERRMHAAVAALEPALRAQRVRDRALQRERQLRRAEQHAVRVHLDLVVGAPVVEPRLHLDLPRDVAAHDHDAPDQPVSVEAGVDRLDRHEVLHLADSALGEEARDQDVGVGEVQLPRRPRHAGRADRVEAAVAGVEDRAEHARRVERRAAVPVDRARGADERDRVQVAYEAVLGDRQVLQREIAGVRHQRLNSSSIAWILPRRRTCRSSPVNSAARKERITSLASAGPITRAPRHSMFTSSCSTHWCPV